MEYDRQKQFDTYNKKLEEFSALVVDEMKNIDEGVKYKPQQQTEQYSSLKNELNFVLEDISQTGEEQGYQWKFLKSYVVIRLRDVLEEMQATYPDVKTTAGESFEDELEVILQFLCSFDTKPPFTIQRLCEIIIDPKKHYKSSKKILFAIEKLVNVSPIDKSSLVF